MNDNYIVNLKENIDTIIKEEYLKYKFKPDIFIEPEKKLIMILPLDAKIFKNKLNKISNDKNISINNKTDKKYEKFEKFEKFENDINIFDETQNIELFTITTNENKEETKTWKKLTIEEKIIKFKDYIDKNSHVNIHEHIIDKVIDLIKDNKINCKKYILYNRVLGVIEDLPLIQLKDNNIVLLTDIESEKKSLRKTKKKINSFIKLNN